MDDYLSKPFTQVGLMNTVEKWLQQGPVAGKPLNQENP
jgi:hypothetical protein